MAQAKWATFEARVREVASYIWGRKCVPIRIGGVNLDGVVKLDEEIQIFIEITENRTLAKVREDVLKLQTAKSTAFTEGVLARCICVIDGEVTPGMRDAGTAHNIKVWSIGEFTKQFFDFESYRVARLGAPFGSSVNPLTGMSDDTKYVPVRYIVEGKKDHVTSADIAEYLRAGRNVVLVGEYGSGKSRCIREVFRHLSNDADKSFCYPVAIDLRRSWGLRESGELIRRHFHDLALEKLESTAIKAFRAGSIAFLLDGFDEIGSQAWSNDGTRLRAIRAKSLEGVKDIVANNKIGTLIAGREHFFSNSEEMFSALGVKRSEAVVVRSKNEFSETELLEYFQNRDIDVDVPPWLPRRPLICQIISDLAADQLAKMFGDEGDEIAFWNHFIRVLCERDASIHISFDADIIFSIFTFLARLTRSKSANVGPISLQELQGAFEAATGLAPVEEASIMLQRLPSLGRVSSETADRQFVDIYILDGLRAKDVVNVCTGSDIEASLIAGTKWANPLDDLGQRVLAKDPALTEKLKLAFATRSAEAENAVLASDLIASLVRTAKTAIDFEGLELKDGEFLYFPLNERAVANLTIKDCVFGELAFPANAFTNVRIDDCLATKVSGISSAAALPHWISRLEADHFDSVESVSRIRKIGLKPSQEILITIIRKTFFQKGAGRKEEALLRGLGAPAAKSLSSKILHVMIRERLLTSFRGSEGTVYSPVRASTRRMQQILDELGGSSDPLWLEVSQL